MTEGNGEVKELPKGWRLATITEICLVMSGQTPKRIEDSSESSGTVPWFRVGNMNEPGNELFLRSSNIQFMTRLAIFSTLTPAHPTLPRNPKNSATKSLPASIPPPAASKISKSSSSPNGQNPLTSWSYRSTTFPSQTEETRATPLSKLKLHYAFRPYEIELK
jgi:hypothetical protein